MEIKQCKRWESKGSGTVLRFLLIPLLFNDIEEVENIVQDQKQNGNRQNMPEETQYKLDNMNNDVKEKT